MSSQIVFNKRNYAKAGGHNYFANDTGNSVCVDATGLRIRIIGKTHKYPRINIVDDGDCPSMFRDYVQSVLMAASRSLQPDGPLAKRFLNIAPRCKDLCPANCLSKTMCGASLVFQRCLVNGDLNELKIDAAKFEPWYQSDGGNFTIVSGQLLLSSVQWSSALTNGELLCDIKFKPADLIVVGEDQTDVARAWRSINTATASRSTDRHAKRRNAGRERLEQRAKRQKVLVESDGEVSDGESDHNKDD